MCSLLISEKLRAPRFTSLGPKCFWNGPQDICMHGADYVQALYMYNTGI